MSLLLTAGGMGLQCVVLHAAVRSRASLQQTTPVLKQSALCGEVFCVSVFSFEKSHFQETVCTSLFKLLCLVISLSCRRTVRANDSSMTVPTYSC